MALTPQQRGTGLFAEKQGRKGRLDRWKPEYKQAMLTMSWLGFSDAQIADTLGVTNTTIRRWPKRHGFEAEMNEARLHADGQVVKALYDKALTGDVAACKTWLAARQRAVWRDTVQVEVEHGLSDRLAMLLEGRQRAAENNSG